MKTVFPKLLAAWLSLSIVAGGCAVESPPSPPPNAAKKDAGRPERKTVPKPRVKLFAGTIEDLDEAAGTLTLKGPKGERRFQAHEQARDQFERLEIGDKVIVKHVDGIALSIVRPRTSKCALGSDGGGFYESQMVFTDGFPMMASSSASSAFPAGEYSDSILPRSIL